MPASAQAAAVAFLALSIGRAINTLFYTAVTLFVCDIYKNIGDEARFGYHATLCLTITSGVLVLCDTLPTGLGQWLLGAAVVVFGTTLLRSKLNKKQTKLLAKLTRDKIVEHITSGKTPGNPQTGQHDSNSSTQPKSSERPSKHPPRPVSSRIRQARHLRSPLMY